MDSSPPNRPALDYAAPGTRSPVPFRIRYFLASLGILGLAAVLIGWYESHFDHAVPSLGFLVFVAFWLVAFVASPLLQLVLWGIERHRLRSTRFTRWTRLVPSILMVLLVAPALPALRPRTMFRDLVLSPIPPTVEVRHVGRVSALLVDYTAILFDCTPADTAAIIAHHGLHPDGHDFSRDITDLTPARPADFTGGTVHADVHTRPIRALIANRTQTRAVFLVLYEDR